LESIEVGKKIKSVRKRKGLTLQELSGKSGVSATAISAIERDVSSPTVSTLAAIGKALGESLSSLLGEGDAEYSVVRADGRRRLASGIRGVDFFALASGPTGNRFTAALAVLPPGGGSGEDYQNHRGDELFFVLSGSLAVELQGQEEILGEGDSLCLRGSTPFRWKNGRDAESMVLIVSSP
jgi:transcriptional regulator with XRE-family HTH domain